MEHSSVEQQTKIDALKKQVPALKRLLARFEETENDYENQEKMQQLKIILQQLSNLRITTSFEELNNCNEIIEKFLSLQNNEIAEILKFNDIQEKQIQDNGAALLENNDVVKKTSDKLYEKTDEKKNSKNKLLPKTHLIEEEVLHRHNLNEANVKNMSDDEEIRCSNDVEEKKDLENEDNGIIEEKSCNLYEKTDEKDINESEFSEHNSNAVNKLFVDNSNEANANNAPNDEMEEILDTESAEINLQQNFTKEDALRNSKTTTKLNEDNQSETAPIENTANENEPIDNCSYAINENKISKNDSDSQIYNKEQDNCLHDDEEENVEIIEFSEDGSDDDEDEMILPDEEITNTELQHDFSTQSSENTAVREVNDLVDPEQIEASPDRELQNIKNTEYSDDTDTEELVNLVDLKQAEEIPATEQPLLNNIAYSENKNIAEVAYTLNSKESEGMAATKAQHIANTTSDLKQAQQVTVEELQPVTNSTNSENLEIEKPQDANDSKQVENITNNPEKSKDLKVTEATNVTIEKHSELIDSPRVSKRALSQEEINGSMKKPRLTDSRDETETLKSNQINQIIQDDEEQSVPDTTESSYDPLEMDKSNIAENEKSNILNNNEDVDNSDDVQIIEDENLPILIDSDDDDIKQKPAQIKPYRRTLIKVASRQRKTCPQPKATKAAFNIEFVNSSEKNQYKIVPKPLYSGLLHKKKNLSVLDRHIKYKRLPPQPRQALKIALTPQTNFLSNMDLQPSGSTGTNPRVFTAQLRDKPVLIPNAFYGTRHSSSSEQQTPTNTISSYPKINKCTSDIAHCRWLSNFLLQFCSSVNIAHNTCYLLLKRVLQPEAFDEICKLRTKMNLSDDEVNSTLLSRLRYLFYKNGNQVEQQLTDAGRKFCEMAFINILDKTISLTVNSKTKAITSRTRIAAATLEAVKTNAMSEININTSSAATLAVINAVSDSNATTTIARSIFTIPQTFNATSDTALTQQRKHSRDDSEYCPPRELSTLPISTTSPRRSLRTSARVSNNFFTYSEDNDDDFILEDDTDKQESETQSSSKRIKSATSDAITAFIARKRIAAQEEQQKQAKSFETAFIETIAQNPNILLQQHLQGNTENVRSQNENEVETFVISDDDDNDVGAKAKCFEVEAQTEPKKHLIHKIVPTGIIRTSAANGKQKTLSRNKPPEDDEVVLITPDTTDEASISSKMPKQLTEVKNTNANVHPISRFHDFCLICNRSISHVVGHYVNAHPEYEVFTSRAPPNKRESLLMKQVQLAAIKRLQNGMTQYVTTCVFCLKECCFTLGYWYQHFSSHTGEYAFKCSGCNLLKSTRSQIITHVKQLCTKSRVELKYRYDSCSDKIEAYMCRLCYFLQLNFCNIEKHLRTQHCLQRSIEQFYLIVTLLQIPKLTTSPSSKTVNNGNKSAMTYNSKYYLQNNNGEIFEISELDETACADDEAAVIVNEAESAEDTEDTSGNNWYTEPMPTSDDLSYMICGMLDVPMDKGGGFQNN